MKCDKLVAVVPTKRLMWALDRVLKKALKAKFLREKIQIR